jgi:hypothetical protein
MWEWFSHLPSQRTTKSKVQLSPQKGYILKCESKEVETAKTTRDFHSTAAELDVDIDKNVHVLRQCVAMLC